jgi:hypothetical protein
MVDPGGEALAAYQVDVRAGVAGDADGADGAHQPVPRVVQIVGIEGGEHPAFREPPYYDAQAMAGDRAVLAAFTLGRDVPREATRVARVNLRVEGPGEPRVDARLMTAGDPSGDRIAAEVRTSVKGAAPAEIDE